MTDEKYVAEAEEYYEALPDSVIESQDITVEQLAEEVETWGSVAKVPRDERERLIMDNYTDDEDGGSGGSGGSNGLMNIADLKGGDWPDLEVKVTNVFDDPFSDGFSQNGVIADETGSTIFGSYKKSELEELEEGVSYRIKSATVNENEGEIYVNFNKNTEFEEMDEEVSTSATLTGAIVNVYDGEGLIKRCENDGCSRVLSNGRCTEHGENGGEYDLRLKITLDDGKSATRVTIGRELVEEFTGITLDDAKEMAQDSLDASVVRDAINDMVFGRFYEVEATPGQYGYYAESIEKVVDKPDFEGMLIDLREVSN